mmetsp:Transcript_27818/g.40979  ORF Transcript_27818/g.40979 Transcript_27818/m.40979 type:complete len:113 (-) Transcript_27818:1296-1634(-)
MCGLRKVREEVLVVLVSSSDDAVRLLCLCDVEAPAAAAAASAVLDIEFDLDRLRLVGVVPLPLDSLPLVDDDRRRLPNSDDLTPGLELPSDLLEPLPRRLGDDDDGWVVDLV